MTDIDDLVSRLRALARAEHDDHSVASEGADMIELLDSGLYSMGVLVRSRFKELENNEAETRAALRRTVRLEIASSTLVAGVFGGMWLFDLWQTGDSSAGLSGVFFGIAFALASQTIYSAYQQWNTARRRGNEGSSP